MLHRSMTCTKVIFVLLLKIFLWLIIILVRNSRKIQNIYTVIDYVIHYMEMIVSYSDKMNMSSGDLNNANNHSVAYHYLSNPLIIALCCNVYTTRKSCERMCVMGDVLSEEPQTSRFPCANGLA